MSKGKIFYGMHFYPGVAEYISPDSEPYRVYLNEDTLRGMDPSFAGRPVFVQHVDAVDDDVDEVRKDADGWVIESFFNQADGKHWVKFIVCSERGERAISAGMRLSNCYIPKSFGDGGLWNGVSYVKEIKDGEFEHLAIVPNPRYEESVIMSPDEFKAYNDSKFVELKRLANNKEKGKGKMAIKLFKRAAVENALDLVATMVLLPKSNREVSLEALCNEADEAAVRAKTPQMANSDHLVKVGGTKMTLNELVAKHKAVCDELEAMKTSKNDDEMGDDDPAAENAADDDDDLKENAEDDDSDEKAEKAEKDMPKENAEDDDVPPAKKKAKDDAKAENAGAKAKPAATKNAPDKDELERRRKAKDKAERLANAPSRAMREDAVVETSDDKVARGKARYGS